MAEKGRYKTKHHEELIQYLQTIPGKHITAGDVCAHFRDEGKSMGTATVYRQLEKLVDEGVVNKYILDENSSACFEYVGAEKHCAESCFHCKCEKCGVLIHLECHELNAIGKHLMANHGFALDPFRTVFYGICQDCQKKLAQG